MDLISREVAIEAIKRLLYEPDSVQYIWSSDALSAVKNAPSVPAVPLDKLCEWLERYATMDCDGCREAFGSCEDAEKQEVIVCNSRERWKAMLIKWMEEEHAAE